MTTINTLVTVNTTEKWDRRLKNSVFIRAFSPTIDEPKNIGGSNGGPNPVEYVLAALFTCTSITIAFVANGQKNN